MGSGPCPGDGAVTSALVRNLVVEDELGELRVRCRFACPAICRRRDLESFTLYGASIRPF